MLSAAEIGADHRHHRVRGALARQWQPFRLGHVPERRAELARQILADRFQVVAGIEALGHRTDVFAQGLAVAKVGRARQVVDLAAGVVDVIFARRRATGKDQEAGERIAEHRAARMPHVHRPGRVRADVFDVDRPLRARRAGPEARALRQNGLQNLLVNLWSQDDIDEARTGGFGVRNVRFALEILGEACGQSARVRAGLLGLASVDHRRVGREVAVRGLARRLDEEAAEVEVARQFSRRDALLDQPGDTRLEVGENVHWLRFVDASARRERAALTQVGSVVKKAGVLGDCEPIGHAGDIVGGRPRALALVSLGGPVRRHG